MAPPVPSVTAPITVPFEVWALATQMPKTSIKNADRIRLIAFTDISPRKGLRSGLWLLTDRAPRYGVSSPAPLLGLAALRGDESALRIQPLIVQFEGQSLDFPPSSRMRLNGRSLTPSLRDQQERKCHKRIDLNPLFRENGIADMSFHIFDSKIPLSTSDEGSN